MRALRRRLGPDRRRSGRFHDRRRRLHHGRWCRLLRSGCHLLCRRWWSIYRTNRRLYGRQRRCRWDRLCLNRGSADLWLTPTCSIRSRLRRRRGRCRGLLCGGGEGHRGRLRRRRGGSNWLRYRCGCLCRSRFRTHRLPTLVVPPASARACQQQKHSASDHETLAARSRRGRGCSGRKLRGRFDGCSRREGRRRSELGRRSRSGCTWSRPSTSAAERLIRS